MGLLAYGETGQKPYTFIYLFIQFLKSLSIPGILLKAWEYIGEQTKFDSCSYRTFSSILRKAESLVRNYIPFPHQVLLLDFFPFP